MERRFTRLGRISGDWDRLSSNRLELPRKSKIEWNTNLHKSGGLEWNTSAQDWNGLKKVELLNSLEEERLEEIENKLHLVKE